MILQAKKTAVTTPTFDAEKAVEALLYVAGRLERKDCHKIFKVLYFADREHLAKYGRPITCDTYERKNYGPVPSAIRRMVNDVKGGRELLYTNTYGEACSSVQAFSVNGYMLIPLRAADRRLLSQSDADELDASIAAYGKLSFDEITEKSHGMAWRDTAPNSPIAMESILREAGRSEEFIEYVTEFFKIERAIAG
jgi:uncharacterized phage-associated protein